VTQPKRVQADIPLGEVEVVKHLILEWLATIALLAVYFATVTMLLKLLVR
jgi:hypothetical protein